MASSTSTPAVAAAGVAETAVPLFQLVELEQESGSMDPFLLKQVQGLLLAYRDELVKSHGVPIDDFQGFLDEIHSLPFKYAKSKNGNFLVAVVPSAGAAGSSASAASPLAVGCVAIKDIGEGVAEIKRLYVTADWRKQRLGKRLMEAIIAEAGSRGYSEVKLDTLKRFGNTEAFYRGLGFEECAAYVDNPMHDVLFFSRKL